MLASLAVRELLIRFSRKGGRAIQQQAIELHPLHGKISGMILKILHSGDEVAIIEEIRQDRGQLRDVFRMINLAVYEADDLAERRNTNKMFFECLIEVESSQALAHIWLIKNIDLKDGKTIMSDWKYEKNVRQDVKDAAAAHKEKVEKSVAARVDAQNCVKISYNGLKRLKRLHDTTTLDTLLDCSVYCVDWEQSLRTEY